MSIYIIFHTYNNINDSTVNVTMRRGAMESLLLGAELFGSGMVSELLNKLIGSVAAFIDWRRWNHSYSGSN
jgi:hypothetical protein